MSSLEVFSDESGVGDLSWYGRDHEGPGYLEDRQYNLLRVIFETGSHANCFENSAFLKLDLNVQINVICEQMKTLRRLSLSDASADSPFELSHTTGPVMSEPCDATATDPLVLFVVQPQGVVSHAQHGDDKVDQSQDAVKPQEVVAERHRNTAVLLRRTSGRGRSHLSQHAVPTVSSRPESANAGRVMQNSVGSPSIIDAFCIE